MSEERGYVMLSYSWAQKVIVRNIRYRLWQEGYRVWIDIGEEDGMRDLIYSDMPNAVKNATVVVACLSKKYEESDNCQTEGCCTKYYIKNRIALKMEEYSLNGWVLAAFVGRLYIDFSIIDNFETNFQALLIRLRQYPDLNPQKNNPTPAQLPPPEPLSSIGSQGSSPPKRARRDTQSLMSTGTPSMSQSSEASNDASSMAELTEEYFEELLTSVSDWCKGRVELNRLKVVVSEFVNDTITLNNIMRMDNTYDLIDLLRTNGRLMPTDISVLVEVIKLCGAQGVEVVIKKKWNVPTLKGLVITHFSSHRINLMAFGRRISTDNIKTIGRLYGFRNETDPYSLILKLEEKGTLKKGENMNKFIKKLDEYNMVNEVEALTHHE